MPSYQDIETRLRTVEAMVEFVLKSFSVTDPFSINPNQSKTLLQVYYDTISRRPVEVGPAVVPTADIQDPADTAPLVTE